MQNDNASSSMLPRANAITMLADDHERVRRLIGEFEKCLGNNETALCKELADVICGELELHAAVEEEIFYPAARELIDRDRLVDVAEVEHGSVRQLVQQVRSLDPLDPRFAATIHVIGTQFRAHSDDEERQLFWLVRQSGLDLEALGDRMRRRRGELAAQLGLSFPNSAEAMPA